MIDLSLVSFMIQGVNFMKDLFFQLKGVETKKVKAIISINGLFTDRNGIAINVAISNVGNKPFSIIEIFIDQMDKRFRAVPIKKIECEEFNEEGSRCVMKGDMIDIDVINNSPSDAVDITAFNFKTFLQPNQAETGWMIFPMRPENLIVSAIGIKFSGELEIFKTVD